jgi:hypothetical protein
MPRGQWLDATGDYLVCEAVCYDRDGRRMIVWDLFVADSAHGEYVEVFTGYKRREYALRRIRRERARYGKKHPA